MPLEYEYSLKKLKMNIVHKNDKMFFLIQACNVCFVKN